MQTFDDGDTEAGKCEDCVCQCKRCNKFDSGDRIELTITGVLYLGKIAVNRGTVIGQGHNESKLIIIRVHWDGYPDQHIGRVNPVYIQKINGEPKAFL